MTPSKLQKQACANPDLFEREHGDIAYAAWQCAEQHYEDGSVVWKRSALEALLTNNWPIFVDQAVACRG